MRKGDNFRLVAVGGLPDVMAQIKLWQDGLRFLGTEATGIAQSTDDAWDRLIRTARDTRHRGDGKCQCHRCRPNRRYK